MKFTHRNTCEECTIQVIDYIYKFRIIKKDIVLIKYFCHSCMEEKRKYYKTVRHFYGIKKIKISKMTILSKNSIEFHFD
jgi:hypothetical protein